MKPIIIQQDSEGALEVIQDGRTTGALTLGEMIEQVLSLVPVTLGAPRYPMKTAKEWDAARAAAFGLPYSEEVDLEEQEGGPTDWKSVTVAQEDFLHSGGAIAALKSSEVPTQRTASAPKFKPGDRVYYESEYTGSRNCGVVIADLDIPDYFTVRSHDIVYAKWDDGAVGFMPASRLFPDLRTVAGGGLLKLEAGRKGRTRDGREIGPIDRWAGDARFVFHIKGYGLRDAEGFFLESRGQHPLDIVELLPEGA